MITKETVAKKLHNFLDGDPGLTKMLNAQGELRPAERDARIRFAEGFGIDVRLKRAGVTFSDLTMIFSYVSRDNWVDICLGEWKVIIPEIPGSLQPELALEEFLEIAHHKGSISTRVRNLLLRHIDWPISVAQFLDEVRTGEIKRIDGIGDESCRQLQIAFDENAVQSDHAQNREPGETGD